MFDESGEKFRVAALKRLGKAKSRITFLGFIDELISKQYHEDDSKIFGTPWLLNLLQLVNTYKIKNFPENIFWIRFCLGFDLK